MNDERDHTEAPKRHRLAWSSALAVVITALCAPLAGAAGVELPRGPLPVDLPSVPDVPEVDVPDVPEVNVPPIVPDVTTLPVPVEELDGAVDPVVDEVVDVVDGIGGGVDEVVDETGDTVGGVVDDVVGDGPVDEVVDDVTDPDGPVGGVVDEVLDPEGPVGGVVDDVTDPDGPVGGVVDDVLDPEGPVGGVVDDVTDPDGPVGGVVDDVTDAVSGVGDGVGSVVDKVGGVVDGVVGPLPDAPHLPGGASPDIGDSSVGSGDVVGGTSGRTPSEVAARRAAPLGTNVSVDGFAANVSAASEAVAVATPGTRDLAAPSLIERIARSASDVAQKIAFPLLLAAAVGAFVVMQNRVDRKDPKLALAAIDADEDLLGFE